ncbi:NAD(P)H-dependent oxidoreductase [Mariprofundus ferrooxydans]|uniref:Trp repressor-binding protein n=1 Tax=Mariprofundus ferrooxydans PV-1 TaxID=314345 RepID=Q0EX75_9PROT|nr:NAD(P)H-dependent oxidoreductase [Mariprofundus ferrooxydans]EAU53915.1 Trp repressor-binding protein [Mariprofundus ferrooxydans PV-1]KON48329.1 Trp repressor-binding protein [Mariprofundus ferrooxydans]
MQVLISYHSDYGNTRKMAEAIAAGYKVADGAAVIDLKLVEMTGLDDLTQADVIILGTPVHMGSMAWPVKKLIDEAGKLWMEGALEGKVGGVFATGGGFGGAGGGIEQTLVSLHSNFLEHGMIVVGFPKSLPGYADGGLQWGPCGRSGNHEGMPAGLSDGSLVAARSYGAHIAEVAARLID